MPDTHGMEAFGFYDSAERTLNSMTTRTMTVLLFFASFLMGENATKGVGKWS